MPSADVRHLSAFSESEGGGNPAGVWLGEKFPGESDMQAIAAAIGYSETAFVVPDHGNSRKVRYFSPRAEVTFCGHATIASGVALGYTEGAGTYVFSTGAGDVEVTVENDGSRWSASFISAKTQQESVTEELLSASLDAIGWSAGDLDCSISPVCAYAGAWHLVLAVKSRQRLAVLDYDFEKLKSLMLEHDLTTLQLVWREDQVTFHSRNPFPVGGVVEDPATGAAAAALGGYLRDAGKVSPPVTLRVRQGEDMGCPSLLIVDIPESGGVSVRGSAVEID